MNKLTFLLLLFFLPLCILQTQEAVFKIEKLPSHANSNLVLKVNNNKNWSGVVFFLDHKELGIAKLEDRHWLYDWDTTKYTDGTYTLTAQAEKDQQRYLSQPISIVIDNTAPSLKLLPYVQKNFGIVDFEIESSDETSEVKDILIWIDQKTIGAAKKITDNKYVKTWDIPDQARGYHLLEIEARDTLGNKAKYSEKIRLDRQGPRIQVLAPLAQGPTQGPLVCEAKITDPSGVGNIEFTLKDHPEIACTTWNEKDRWGCKWENLPDGSYQICLVAWDNLGNQTSLDIYTQIDTSPPLISWKKPTERTVISGPIDMEVDVLDDGGILETILEIVETDIPPIPFQRNEYRWRLTWTPPYENEYKVKATTTDLAGNKSSIGLLSILYDTTPPQGNWLDPSREYYSDTFSIKVHAEDNISGIDRVELQIGDQTLQATPEKEGVWEAEIHVENSGVYYLQCILWDKAGNNQVLNPLRIQIDKDPPLGKIEKPNPLLFHDKGQITIYTEDTISGVQQIRLFLNKKEIARQDTPESITTLDIDLHEYTKGEHDFVLEVIDNANNTTYVNSKLWIDREPPKIIPRLQPTELQIGMVKLSLQLQDEPAGIDIKSKPIIVAHIQDREYPFTIESYNETICEAELLITNNHPIGKATVEVRGVQDNLGHTLDSYVVGSFQIKNIGGAWPLLPQNQIHPNMQAYSDNTTPDKSGVWIASIPEAPVYSIEDGKIVEIHQSQTNTPGYIRIQRLRGQQVWGYHHINIGKNQSTQKHWVLGDIVKANNIIGTVSTIPNQENSFLYLELCEWDNGWKQIDDPLKYIEPQNTARTYSPSILWYAQKQYENVNPVAQYSIPKSIRFQTQPQKRYSFKDFLLIMYFFIVIGVIYIHLIFKKHHKFNIRMKLKNKNYS
ncbi:MAG: Ig-like domain repeat protein [Planctomycetes bacterium]|nr:Ig-like domain repeat protein [Planctomycetota bacterium]